jgi:hypothetical protein
VLTLPAGGVITRPWPGDETEQRKTITTVVNEGHGIILFDNVRGQVRSAPLEGVLTAWPTWGDRILGSSTSVQPQIIQTWLMTANNMQLGGDLTRRVIRIRLDANMEFPEHRQGWKHHLPEWGEQHRADLVQACLTLCRWWTLKGSPEPSIPGEHSKGSFEAWQTIIGGILQTAEVPGFLENVPEVDAADETHAALADLLTTLREAYGTDTFTSADAADRVPKLWERLGITSPVAIGRRLGAHKDDIASGLVLRAAPRSGAEGRQWTVSDVIDA